MHLSIEQMKNLNEITIEFILAYSDKTMRQSIKIKKGSMLLETKSYLNKIFLRAWEKSNAIAIDTVLVSPKKKLFNSVRVVILRELVNDPKQLRRNRANNTQNNLD
jgi:putative ubiquitin-RnfH superfamily antitoxin RatB of RatAB toxin-antitoxin module